MLKVWMSHGDKVTRAAGRASRCWRRRRAARSPASADEARGYYGVQFHPEVTHTVQGRALLNRFVLDIAGARPDWVMGNYIDEAVARIREQVGSEEVLLGLSGGVDSSVAAALIHRAIGDQLTCVFVDHGLLRLSEAQMVMDMFAGQLHGPGGARRRRRPVPGAPGRGHRSRSRSGKIIGREFVEVFQAEAKKLTERALAGAGHDLSRRDRVG